MQSQGRRRHDGDWRRGVASPCQDVENDVARVKFGAERLCTGCFNRTKPIGQNRTENVDHLPITVIDGGELATNALDSSRQHPVLKVCAIAQRSGLARQDRHIMPGIVNRLSAARNGADARRQLRRAVGSRSGRRKRAPPPGDPAPSP